MKTAPRLKKQATPARAPKRAGTRRRMRAGTTGPRPVKPPGGSIRPRTESRQRVQKPNPSRPAGHPAETAAPVSPKRSALDISRILVPIDFSVHSKNAPKYAIPLAEQFGASLHLVFVVEPTIYPADLGFGQVVLPGVEEELRQKAIDELNGLIEREIGTRVAATAAVRTGSPHQEILDEAEEQKVNLIVVASHGHSGVEQILFGSTADRIVHKASCPVLTIRPAEGESR